MFANVQMILQLEILLDEPTSHELRSYDTFGNFFLIYMKLHGNKKTNVTPHKQRGTVRHVFNKYVKLPNFNICENHSAIISVQNCHIQNKQVWS